MKNTYVEIVRRFFAGHFSIKTRLTFHRFLSLESFSGDERESVLYELWQDCLNTTPDDKTIQDWNKVCNSIGLKSSPARNKRVWKRMLFYSLSIVCVILSWFVSGRVHTIREDPVSYTSLSAKIGELKSVVLPDNSIVWINGGTTILYPSTFSPDIRTVYLSGEARFDISKDSQRPFIVKTPDMDVKVVGTVFNVRSYPDEKYTSAVLESGIVQVTINGAGADSLYLNPNERIVLDRLTDSYEISSVDASRTSMWYMGYLVFENADISTIISAIELKYNVEVLYDSKRFNGTRLNIQYSPEESIEEVMDVLSHLTNVKWKIDGNTIYFN